MIVSINQEIVNEESAKISIFDRGFLYGDSVYEVILTYNAKPFLIEEHLDRLWRSARSIGLEPKLSRDEITAEIKKGIKKLGHARQYIRFILTRGAGEISLDPAQSDGQNLIIIFKELPDNPVAWYENGVHVIIADTRRSPKSAIDPSIKSGNYLNNVMALKEAKEQGAFDAIMLNGEGQVSECTTSNIWIVKDKTLITPPLSAGLLGGITRAKLLNIAKEHNYNVKEEVFDVQTLYQANECFLTSSTKELVPITKIDQHIIGTGKPGTVTKNLHKHYLDFVAKILK
jgi:branched-chain amino acid aminotransferase